MTARPLFVIRIGALGEGAGTAGWIVWSAGLSWRALWTGDEGEPDWTGDEGVPGWTGIWSAWRGPMAGLAGHLCRLGHGPGSGGLVGRILGTEVGTSPLGPVGLCIG